MPLYLSEKRPVVERDGVLILVDDDRLEFQPGEKPMEKYVRFRTLGCYPLTGAVDRKRQRSPKSSRKCSWRPHPNGKAA